MTLPNSSGARYERWRSQWLAGTNSQALATLRWHGLAVALSLTAPLATRAVTAAPAPAITAHPAAIAEAARQVRAFLHPPGGHILA